MEKSCFLQALGIEKNDVVSIAGAGGKTSLMFRLAEEAKGLGFKVLVTTSTKIFVPDSTQYDRLDLSGTLFFEGECVILASMLVVCRHLFPVKWPDLVWLLPHGESSLTWC